MMSLTLRPATEADAKILFDWRNDLETRKNSRNTDPVSWKDHIQWVVASLKRSDRELLIAEQHVAVGTVRLDYSGDTCELSWTVAPEHRRKGFGREMVRLAMRQTRAPILIAEIKPENKASFLIAQSLGFVEVARHDGLIKLQLSQSK